MGRRAKTRRSSSADQARSPTMLYSMYYIIDLTTIANSRKSDRATGHEQREGLDSPHLNPIEPTNLRLMARAAIRTHVITGQLKPGHIYPVSYFASRLGVS